MAWMAAWCAGLEGIRGPAKPCHRLPDRHRRQTGGGGNLERMMTSQHANLPTHRPQRSDNRSESKKILKPPMGWPRWQQADQCLVIESHAETCPRRAA